MRLSLPKAVFRRGNICPSGVATALTLPRGISISPGRRGGGESISSGGGGGGGGGGDWGGESGRCRRGAAMPRQRVNGPVKFHTGLEGREQGADVCGGEGEL